MEDQVPSSNFPEQQQEFVPPPNVPDFKAMREKALQDAIQQVKERQGVPQPQTPPPGMELSMDGSQYVPQKYPVAPQYQQPQVQPQPIPEPKVVYLRRNLTLAELGVTFLIAIGIVAGVQGIWHVASDVIPRIEIREK